MRGAGRARQSSAGHRPLPLWGLRYRGPAAQLEPVLALRSISQHCMERGEAESNGCPELSSPPLQAPPGGLAEGGKKGRREGERRLAKEEGPGGGSLIQTRHR